MLVLQSFLKERKYPFILSLFVLLMFVTFLLISNSQSFVFVNYTGVNITETQSPSQNGTSSIIAANMKSLPSLQPCEGPGMVDYIPCLDNWKAIKTFKKLVRKERHCPTRPSPRCLVPLPKGYKTPVPWPKSRDMVRLILLLFGGKSFRVPFFFFFPFWIQFLILHLVVILGELTFVKTRTLQRVLTSYWDV